MSGDETLDSYEVGYGKPPKSTQFQKGMSGNPNGRPKKVQSFDHELLQEANALMTINENGQQKLISKHQVVIKQLMKQAMTGSASASRLYFELSQQAQARIALVAEFQPNDSRNDDAKSLTDEQLMRIAARGLEKAEHEIGKK